LLHRAKRCVRQQQRNEIMQRFLIIVNPLFRFVAYFLRTLPT